MSNSNLFSKNTLSLLETRRNKILPIAIFFFFLSLYIVTSKGQLVVSDENVMYQVTKSIVEEGNFDTPQMQDTASYKGKFYAHSGVGTSIAAIPFYVLGKRLNKYVPTLPGEGMPKVMVSMMPTMVMALSCLTLYLLSCLLGYSQKTSALLALIYGLSTMVWRYSNHMWTDVLATLFLLLSVYELFHFIKNQRRDYHLFLIGMFLGLGVAAKVTIIIFIPLIATYLIYILIKNKYSYSQILKKLIVFCIPLILVLFFVGLYNFMRFDSWFETGYAKAGYPVGLKAVSRYLGIDNPFIAFIIGIYGYLMSPGKSVFLYSPVLFLSLFTFKNFWNRYPHEATLFLSMCFANLIFHSNLAVIWLGGWCWGPRYLLPIIAFQVLPLGIIFEKWPILNRPIKTTAVLIIVLSFIIQIASVSVDWQRYILEYKKRQGIGYYDSRNLEWGRPVYDIRYSPLLGQFYSLYKVIKTMVSGQAREFPAHIAPEQLAKMDKIDIDLNSLQLNSLAFWWVTLYYMNFPRHLLLILLFILVATMVSSLFYIFLYIKRFP